MKSFGLGQMNNCTSILPYREYVWHPYGTHTTHFPLLAAYFIPIIQWKVVWRYRFFIGRYTIHNVHIIYLLRGSYLFPYGFSKKTLLLVVSTISKYRVFVLHLSLKSFSFNKQSMPFAHNMPVKYYLGFFFNIDCLL